MDVTHPLASRDSWSDAVYFTPFVGPLYDDGLVPGVRVLLLGESHYATAEEAMEWAGNCTQIHFNGYLEDDCNLQDPKAFFRKLPRIVTRKSNPTQRESAEAWRRVAFANFAQDFVSETARVAPSDEKWARGQAALTEMALVLKPNVVLVLGARLWDHISDGRKSGEPWIKGDRRDREVWLIKNEKDKDSYARSSWIYHPSTNYETPESAIRVLNELLERAQAGHSLPAPDPAGKVITVEEPDA